MLSTASCKPSRRGGGAAGSGTAPATTRRRGSAQAGGVSSSSCGALKVSRIPSLEPRSQLRVRAVVAAAVTAAAAAATAPSASTSATAAARAFRMPDPAVLDALRESCVDGAPPAEASSNKKQVPQRTAERRRPAVLGVRRLDERLREAAVAAAKISSVDETECDLNNRTISGCAALSADNCRIMDANGNTDDFRTGRSALPVPVGARAGSAAAAAASARRRAQRISLPPLAALEFPPPPAIPPTPPLCRRASMGDSPTSVPYQPTAATASDECGLGGGCADGEDDDEYYEAPCETRDYGGGLSGMEAAAAAAAAAACSVASPLSPSTAVVALCGLRSPLSTNDSTPTEGRGAPPGGDDCSQPSIDMVSVDSGTGSEPSAARTGTPLSPPSPPSSRVVVAIDFGTAFSGYAYSFVDDDDRLSGRRVHVMRRWEGGDPGLLNQKIPTCLLLTPDGAFHSFGYGARDFFNNLDDQEARRWCFFDKFKMVLHGQSELTEQTVLIASNGVKIAAHTIFAYALGFFKDHALKELADQRGEPVPLSDIKWVITVPAIWKQPAKQFMRQSAYEAGLGDANDPTRLLISLEPEAASIYCRHQKFKQLVPVTPPPPPPLSVRRISDISAIDGPCVGDTLRHGSRYMVVDCGGGTVDITVHEIDCEAGQLNEVHRASGGPYGSAGVDARFEVLLKDIFSGEFIDAFKKKRPAGYIDLMVCFEARKRSASPFKDSPLNVALPFSFIDYYEKQKGHSVKSAIKRFNDPEVLWSQQGMLRLTQTAMRRLFLPILDSIKQAIGDVLNHPEVKGVEDLFLVGGFAESPLLQHEIRKDFSSILKVIIPQDASMSIVKGAVMYGLDPTVVRVRRCPLTYGIGVLHRYVAGKHPPNKVIERDGQQWCTDVFDRLVTANQAVAPGEAVVRSYTPANAQQTAIVINMYCTERRDVEFVTDPGVKKCATLRLELGGDGAATLQRVHRREIQARVAFGDTEIKVTALDVESGCSAGAAVDFIMK